MARKPKQEPKKSWNDVIQEMVAEDQARVTKDDTVLHGEDTNALRIDAIWAFVSVGEDGNEGVCAYPMGDLGPVPMIAADETRLKDLIPMAEHLASITHMTIKLIRLSTREDVRVIRPGH
jgi:hypothetical protein